MQRRQLDAVVLGLPHHVYYFSAFLQHTMHHAAIVLTADGRSCLIRANTSATTAATDDAIAFERSGWRRYVRNNRRSSRKEPSIGFRQYDPAVLDLIRRPSVYTLPGDIRTRLRLSIPSFGNCVGAKIRMNWN